MRPDFETNTRALQRQSVSALIVLSNATSPRRPVGFRKAIVPDPFASHTTAKLLLEPLGLERELGEDEIDELQKLAAETRHVAEALVNNRLPPSIDTINRLAGQGRGTQTLRIEIDGTLSVDVRWHSDTAVIELACRIMAELGRFDPARLRRCAREACDLFFYDTTRSRTQRWHSESTCGQRERQDRWKKIH